jgi:hypothetical protein
MKKNNAKKLALSRETLLRLNGPQLGKVAGGAWSDESVCPTTGPSEVRFCARNKDEDHNTNHH